MGSYINKNSKGESIGSSFNAKVSALIADGGEKISPPTEWKEGLVCIIDNGHWAGAGYAYNEEEMKVFRRDTMGRPTQWLDVPHAKQIAE